MLSPRTPISTGLMTIGLSTFIVFALGIGLFALTSSVSGQGGGPSSSGPRSHTGDTRIPTLDSRFKSVRVHWDQDHSRPASINFHYADAPIHTYRIELAPWPEDGSEASEILDILTKIYNSEDGFLDDDGNKLNIQKSGASYLHDGSVEGMEDIGSFNPFREGAHESWLARLKFEGDMVKIGVRATLEKHLGIEADTPTFHPDVMAISETDATLAAIQQNRLTVLAWLDGYFSDPRYETVRSHKGTGMVMHERMIILGRFALVDEAMQGRGWEYYETEMGYDPFKFRALIAPQENLWVSQMVHGKFSRFQRSIVNTSDRGGLVPRVSNTSIVGDVRSITEDDVFIALGYLPGTLTTVPMD